LSKLDIDFVRSQFPAFAEPTLENWGFFENAGGSYPCRQVVEQLHGYYTTNKVQPYGFFPASQQAGDLMDRARERMAAFLNVATPEVHFGPSTSQNTYVLAQALRQYLKPGDEIIVTDQDHEANIGVWRRLEADGFVLRQWSVVKETAELDPADLDLLLNEKTRVVAFTHCSNIVGSMHPVADLTARIRAAGALSIIDGVSYCGHGLPDVRALGADIYMFSLYKVYGPHQGVMVMRSELNRALANQGHFFNTDHETARFTPAGPDHAQIAAINGVIDYFESLYSHHFADDPAASKKAAALLRLFQSHEQSLLKPLLEFLDGHPAVTVIGRTDTRDRAPTVAITIRGKNPAEIAGQLKTYKIAAGASNFYAYRLMESLGIDPDEGVLRLSFVHYTTRQEISRLISALDEILPA
jgi:cysteine desulfurase family protein (TIGR01976 family)